MERSGLGARDRRATQSRGEPSCKARGLLRVARVGHASVAADSLEHSDPGGHIQLDVEREAASVPIVVQDNGVRIAPDMLSSLLDLICAGSSNH